MQNLVLLLGRILMAAIFVWSGYNKVVHYDYVQGLMVSMGLPAWSIPFIILWELGGGLALLLGLFTRPVALALAAFCVISAFIAHLHPEDQMQMINFMKNVAMTGGFLYVWVAGGGEFSLGKKLGLKWS